MTVLVLATPVVWSHYLVLLYLPWLHALAQAGSQRWTLMALGLSYFLLAAATLMYAVPGWLVPLTQPLPIVGSLLLLGVQLRQLGGPPHPRSADELRAAQAPVAPAAG
jgi:hypothetical protein